MILFSISAYRFIEMANYIEGRFLDLKFKVQRVFARGVAREQVSFKWPIGGCGSGRKL